MRILGLDLSLTSTGYCLLSCDADRWLITWHGSVSPACRDVERLAVFDTWIRDTLDHRGDPRWPAESIDHVAIEGYSFASKFRGPQLGELGGVMKLAIHQAGIPIAIIPPATWKKALCGKGNLDKRNASVEISRRYDVHFATEDTLDAWAVAECLRRQLLGLDKPEPKTHARKVSARNQSQLTIASTEEAHDKKSAPASRRTAGSATA